ncbi:glycosyl hydrolase family 28-related protein [Mucilaginibacter hurinus]|uniref:glycosyl hydrolase family 28-related protein n=1 Tax=Mucilaginibacter hurinus TaxID=2201324 RepID=UPI0013147BBD|nr:glycosyl hydrolase family 28-related protein [Mucilaginibacter hurinus]
MFTTNPGYTLPALSPSIPVKQNAIATINVVSLGADNTGFKDCSDIVRKAQEMGNVYFPAGTYLMSTVDVISNRKYFGDGMGKTIIKSNYKKVKAMWAISTKNFDKSGHPKRNIENVELCDMTLDYNLTKWIDYFSMIIFKGGPANYIRNVKIQRIEFIDSGKWVHPDANNGKGKDMWSINLSSFASKTEDILVDNCISNAESKQFVAGGGSWLKNITVTNNYIKKPHANGIAFTTVSDGDVTFDGFIVKNNTIVDAFGSAILFGNDPGTDRLNGGKQTFSNLLVANNKIILSDYNVYGKSYRTKKSYPYVVNLSGADPYMKNVTIRDNEIEVKPEYSGGDIALGKIRSYAFKRTPVVAATSFTQPKVNSNVVVKYTPIDKGTYIAGSFIKINNVGMYEIVSATATTLTLKLTNWYLKATPGALVPAGSKLYFKGGILENVTFANNKITGSKLLQMVPGGLINNLTLTGNNNVDFSMRYANVIIDNVVIKNNTNLYFRQTDGFIRGNLTGNKMTNPSKKSNKLLNLSDEVIKSRQIDKKNELQLQGNSIK